MSFCAPSQVAMFSVLATALPPSASISSTTAWAGASLTLAVARATEVVHDDLRAFGRERFAWARPIPSPAPVTMTTRPSHDPATVHPCFSSQFFALPEA